MGMPISVHVRGERAHDDVVAAAVADLFDELREVEARFSPFREDSELCRLQRGEVELEHASDDMREVERLCRTALERTDGWFDAWHSRPDGLFDPTGLTKTWGVGRAARHLDSLPGLGLRDRCGRRRAAAPDPRRRAVADRHRGPARPLAHPGHRAGVRRRGGDLGDRRSRRAHPRPPHRRRR